jgi:enoyl-CoA hydratase/carnithine racemase
VGALQAMTRFIGPGRAAEYLLSATSIDSSTASRIGLINTSFSTAEELRVHVDALALRIASSSRDGIKYTKLGIRENLAGTGNIEKDMERFQELAGKEETQGVISRVLEITEGEGGMDFELGWPERISDIWK